MPAFATLYQRLTLPESKRYEEAKRADADNEYLKEKDAAFAEVTPAGSDDGVQETQLTKKAHFSGMPSSHSYL